MTKIYTENEIFPKDETFLKLENGILSLNYNDMSMNADFKKSTKRLVFSNLKNELIVKAVQIKGERPEFLNVLDATAGFGEDSLLLAGYGFRVILYERNEFVGLLLQNALERAKNDSDNPVLQDAASKMTFIKGDSIAAMNEKKHDVDVVVLDPMFPERNKSGLIKKKFQLIHEFISPCEEEEILMDAALNSGARKIVVKRPLKAPFLAGVKPNYSVKGKNIRYDVILSKGEL